ncbi:hypothetical protein, partial [Staphylococcus warneri]|uniref:hypothetical protein n=1 Tax=Staphylococcus warneri TaxID=1292 RepID=UPI0037049F02
MQPFHNSNIQPLHPLSPILTFLHAKPHKNPYPKYKIKTLQPPNDYKSMPQLLRPPYTP